MVLFKTVSIRAIAASDAAYSDFASTIQSCSMQIFRVDGYPVSKHFI